MVVRDSQGRQLVAPDGGWGWLVVLGVSVCNFSTRSLEPSFGLLFGDLLKDLNVETTGAAVIMSTMDFMINFSGMFVGPLMKTFSYRKVALFGSVLSAVGLLLTAGATSMPHILATYSIIRGLGVGFAWSSTLIALNHYFTKRRGQAVGLSMAGTAVGFMLMPQAVQLLLEAYDFSGSVLILSAISLNATVGAALMQPIKWHMKPVEDDVELKACESEEETEESLMNSKHSRKTSLEVNRTLTTRDINKNEQQFEIKESKENDSYWQRIVRFMDFDLLKDPIYLNIIFGISLFFVAELNFKMVIPFFMADLGYTKSETAFCLSMMAVSDMIARVLLPPICDRINITRRTLFAVSAVSLGISRSILAEQTAYVALLSTLAVSGLFRGATLINYSLSISEHVSLEKLPAALGLHMIAKGLFTVCLGPVIGVIRDVTGSYPICLHAQTVMIFLCCLAWFIEYLVRKYKHQDHTQNNT